MLLNKLILAGTLAVTPLALSESAEAGHCHRGFRGGGVAVHRHHVHRSFRVPVNRGFYRAPYRSFYGPGWRRGFGPGFGRGIGPGFGPGWGRGVSIGRGGLWIGF